METQMPNDHEWQKKPEVQKGTLGENLVRAFLEERGWVIYQAVTRGPHAFDMLAIKKKVRVCIAEVKTKARMNHYAATGFNVKHRDEYLNISEQHNMEVVVFFVDELLGKIYYAQLSKIQKPYTAGDGRLYPMLLANDTIVVYSLELMTLFAEIHEDHATVLKELSHRNYEYGETGKGGEWWQLESEVLACSKKRAVQGVLL